MRIRIKFLMFLSLILMFTSFSSTYASEVYGETDLQNKINLYKLDKIADILNTGDNEIIYHWTDIDGISRSVELVVTVNEENGNISLVKEKNNSSTKEINAIKTSIEQKDLSFNTLALPEPLYKMNGGQTRSQFANDHAFDRHQYLGGSTATCSRSRYAQDIDVKNLRSTTIALPDDKFSQRNEADNSWNTVFIKQFGYRTMSQAMPDYGYTSWHRVIKSGSVELTHHPLCY